MPIPEPKGGVSSFPAASRQKTATESADARGVFPQNPVGRGPGGPGGTRGDAAGSASYPGTAGASMSDPGGSLASLASAAAEKLSAPIEDGSGQGA